ncbi:hypothetical protein [Deinococcus sp.]|uniref:hypothetical protein n=1 Tax=Deinococcus sp. TaxID=47478 RepID=UPI003CC51C0F
MKWIKAWVVWALVLVGLLNVFALADPSEDQMKKDMQSLYNTWKDRNGGWTLLSAQRQVSLAEEDEEASFKYDLKKGQSYKFVTACDENCGDLSLVLSDAKGNVVGRALYALKGSELNFNSPETGSYSLTMTMGTCADYYCYYGVDIYQAKVLQAVATPTPAPKPTSPPPPPSPAPVPTLQGPSMAGSIKKYEEQVTERLKDVFARWDDGSWFQRPPLRVTGVIKNGASAYYSYTFPANTFELQPESVLKIEGVCDEDCGDFSIVVFDSAGKQLASSGSTDGSQPNVTLIPEYNGDYSIQLIMARCIRAAGCNVGVDVYQEQPVKANLDLPAKPKPATLASASKNDAAKTQIAGELQRVYNVWKIEPGGWTLLSKLRSLDKASELEATYATYDLKKGQWYKFVAACDDNCSDLPIELFDSKDRLVAAVNGADAKSSFDFIAGEDGNYRLQSSMLSCDVEPCAFGIDIYQASDIKALMKQAPGAVAAPSPVRPAPTPIVPATNSTETKLMTPSRATGTDGRQGDLVSALNDQAEYELKNHQLTLLGKLRYLNSMPANRSDFIEYSLDAGTTYSFLAQCEKTCSGIFYELRDSEGSQLDQGYIASIGIKHIQVVIKKTGLYKMIVNGMICPTGSCYFGVDIYQKSVAGTSVNQTPPAPPKPDSAAASAQAVSSENARVQAIRRLDSSFDPLKRVYEVRPNSRIILPKLYKVGESVPINLSNFAADQDLLIVAACDDQCTSLTLELRDPTGKLVQNKTDGFGSPFIDFYPHGGTYELTVRMERCSNRAGCAAAIEVYKRQ